MRIEEGSLLERLNQKRERRLSTPYRYSHCVSYLQSVYRLFTGLLICSLYQATPACRGLKPLKNTLRRFMYYSPRLAAATRPRQLLVFSWTRSIRIQLYYFLLSALLTMYLYAHKYQNIVNTWQALYLTIFINLNHFKKVIAIRLTILPLESPISNRHLSY